MKAKSSKELFEIGVGAVFLGTTLFSLILGLLMLGTPVMAQSGPCVPLFIEVAPPIAAWVPVGHGINMVFGPADPACTTICWDTLSFHGWLNVMHSGMIDTVYLGPGDVEFWFGDYPHIGIEYHHPGDWPYGATIHGGWVITTCDSVYEDGNVYFHTLVDSTPEPDCGISFLEAIPEPGETVMDSAHPVTMIFGPFNPVCSTLCVDTASFEGIITMGFPGMMDTIYLDAGDVEFDFSVSPNVGIIYTPEPSWPFGPSISARFAISDCDSNRANGLTHFLILSDSTSDTTGDCDPVLIEVSPPIGAIDVPVDHPITLVFGPADTSCTSMCWDTMSFEGWVMYPGDTIELNYSDVTFDLSSWPNIIIEYEHFADWPMDGFVWADFFISNCDGVEGSGLTYFTSVEPSPPIEDPCLPVYILEETYPFMGVASVWTDVIMTWISENPDSCSVICVGDTAHRWGNVRFSSISDSIIIDESNTTLEMTDTSITITYHPSRPLPIFEPPTIEIFFHDCYGDTVRGYTTYLPEYPIPYDSHEVTWIAPLDSFSACSLQEIILVFEPEVRDSMMLMVDMMLYSVGFSPELTVIGDTVIYTPAFPWIDGDHMIGTGDPADGWLEFAIDKTPPVSYAIFPSDDGFLPVDSSVIRIHLHEPPTASGVDLESSTLQLFVHGVPAGTHNLDEPGIAYDDPILEIDLEILDPSLVFSSGDDVTIIFGIRDNVSTEYCGPNLYIWSLDFTIVDTLFDLHVLHGVIVDESTGAPLGGIAVQVFNYLGSVIPGLVDTTGSAGGYEIGVYPGVYSLGAFDPAMAYHPVFYHDRYDLLSADPIIVNPLSPSVVVLDTLHMYHAGGGAMFSVSGIISEAGDGPIDAAYVVAISSEDDEIESAVITNPYGEYVLGLPNGEYIILAFHESYMPGFYGGSFLWASAETVAVSGAPIGGLDIELMPMFPGGGDFRLFGTVFSDDGGRAVTTAPQRGARVYLVDAGSEQMVSATVSDYAGHYEFENLDAGTYRLIPDLVGYEPVSSGWDIIVSGSSEVNLSLVEYTNIPEKDLRAYDFELNGIAPNPFNSACAISYSIDRPGDVAIEVFDVNGRLVETIENRSLPAGEYITVWNPVDIPSGVYLVRITHGEQSESKRVLLVK